MKYGKCNYKTGKCYNCDFGFEGAECDSNLHLKCINGLLLDKSKCRCFNGWTGAQCDVKKCELPCLHGKCDFLEEESEKRFVQITSTSQKDTNEKMKNYVSKCICEEGYTGKFCHVNLCKATCDFGYCNSSNQCVCANN